MKNHSFRDMEGYHKYLARFFRKRKVHLTKEQLRELLDVLGFEFDLSKVKIAQDSGTNSRVYLADGLAVKIRAQKLPKDKAYIFFANKLVSDHFYPKLPVVNVLAYDHFDKTNYEILVMKKMPGRLLVDDFFKLNQKLQKKLFAQILDVSNEISELTFKDWGDIRHGDKYKSFPQFLRAKINKFCKEIIEQQMASADRVILIKKYFFNNVKVFDEENIAHLVHMDINNANVIYKKDKISGLYDFDAAIKGPRIMMVPKIIASIEDMSGVMAGTRYAKVYRNLKFKHLYSTLKTKLSDVFRDPNLLLKLNLIFIYTELRSVSKNKYGRWSKEVIDDIVRHEVVKNNNSLDRTYYAQILKRMES